MTTHETVTTTAIAPTTYEEAGRTAGRAQAEADAPQFQAFPVLDELARGTLRAFTSQQLARLPHTSNAGTPPETSEITEVSEEEARQFCFAYLDAYLRQVHAIRSRDGYPTEAPPAR